MALSDLFTIVICTSSSSDYIFTKKIGNSKGCSKAAIARVCPVSCRYIIFWISMCDDWIAFHIDKVTQIYFAIIVYVNMNANSICSSKIDYYIAREFKFESFLIANTTFIVIYIFYDLLVVILLWMEHLPC
jgi:hypothetical protein